MMTPSQLRQYEFKTAGRNAYKAEDVDSFFGEVLVSYERMYRENSELIKRVSLLADRLEQYKNDEVDIKQAVLSAQKAADIIVRDAQAASEDAKLEAEAILAAAKGEAQIIKSDAEKQAIADSDLLMSVARDKAEEILNKAKEKAHGILIAANDTASDTVGAANRTITSESLHYDMLKKEVSEFRASILAQYKAHIEMISKLPELAVEEAAKMEQAVSAEPVDVSVLEKVYDDEETSETNTDEVLEFVNENEVENDLSEIVSEKDSCDVCETEIQQESVSSEPIPADTFENDMPEQIEEIIFNDDVQDAEPVINETPADIPISRRFAINTSDLDFDGFDDSVNDDNNENVITDNFDEAESDSSDDTVNDIVDKEPDSASSFFDSIESISTDDEESKPRRRGLFGKWK
ncbi:MAG: DivIVA domain-containing protein [Clostridia bacterium]|nr:DivIVA domain-containing protein [Clostridia bacterium]